ncbi:MAG TPA: CHAT domain-containing protein, partial [Pyrinomonadaceae bacterium]|nr:CHAT domain-containing protein [Pyrinomonadaceae bacterium]
MSRLSRLSCRLLPFCLAAGLVLGVTPKPTRTGAADSPGGGGDLSSVEARRQTLSALETEAERERRERDVASLARTLNRAVEIHLKLNDPDAALAAALEALTAARQSKDERLLVDTLNSAAAVQRSRHDYKTALSLLDEAHGLSVRDEYRRGEAGSLTELCVVYFLQSDLGKAEAAGLEALGLWRGLQDKRGEAGVLFNLGETYMRLGKLRESADALETSAALWHELGGDDERAEALVMLNFLSIREGQWQRALAYLTEARSLVKDQSAEPFRAGQIAMSMGEVYEAYGQLETALGYFKEALALYRDGARDEVATIDAVRKVGHVEARIGDYDEAVRQIKEGLGLAQKIENRYLAALCHESLGKVYLSAGLYPPSEQEFQEAVALYEETGNRREWARAQAFLGQTNYLQGKMAAARDSYRKAIEVFQQKIDDYANEAAVCFGLGKLELDERNFNEAGKHLRRSIELTEQLRGNAAGKELRSSFLDSVHDRYEAYAEWLMQLHDREPDKQYDVAAFEASELGRARSLLDSVKDQVRELRRPADPALLEEEKTLQREVQGALDEQAKLQSAGAAPADLAKVEEKLKRLRADYETLEARINTAARFNDLMRPAPLKLAEIRSQVTDKDTALLEYSLGGRESYLWVVTADGFSSYKLAGKEVIEKAARKLAVLLSTPETAQAELRESIAEVSRLVLGPAADKLRVPRLVIVADGILQYIPFQPLTLQPDGEPLNSRFEIVNAPSASTLALVRQGAAGRAPAPKLLAAFGDPVLPTNYQMKLAAMNRDEQGELLAHNEGARTRGAADEAEERLDPAKVRSLFYDKLELNELRKTGSAGEVAIYSDFDATRDNLRNLDLSQYRILHFATHGFLNAKQPELSGLVLSLVDRDGRTIAGFVGLSDIYNLRAPVDLVVLSACSTALGKEMRGEGLVGLTRGFMYAGASTVVASLWKVDDEATAELMKRFYANLLQGGMTPAEALRAAQNSIRREPQWSAPYYWAGFTLQGEYRQVIKPARVSSVSSVYPKMTVAAVVLGLLGAAAAWRV